MAKQIIYLIVTLLLLLLFLSLFLKKRKEYANIWDMYRYYKTKAEQARNRLDFKDQRKFLIKAAKTAKKEGRKDVAAWQYNNAAYSLIVEIENKKKEEELDQIITKYKREIKQATEWLEYAVTLSFEVNDKQKKDRISKIRRNQRYLKNLLIRR